MTDPSVEWILLRMRRESVCFGVRRVQNCDSHCQNNVSLMNVIILLEIYMFFTFFLAGPMLWQ